MSKGKKYIPWVEKYRPERMEDIVLDGTNKKIMNNIIEMDYFPNLLFYGPPGTGKTTTIINLINRYQEKHGQKRKDLKIHLNASDDRGIDIIRNKINQFVNTGTLFQSGMKFVILDEVDYMTKNAQQALRYLIQDYSNNIRFCLICNYICRIDFALQNEFLKLKYCQLPDKEIYRFLNKIQKNENLNISKEKIKGIQSMFESDIRSMINYIQSNSNQLKNLKKDYILTESVWSEFSEKLKKNSSINTIKNYITGNCKKYNIKADSFIKKYIKHLLKTNKNVYTDEWFKVMYFIVHNLDVNQDYIVDYFSPKFLELYKLL
jgi:replication factor C subunit 3/5